MNNLRQIERFFEAMALNAIVEDIMKDDSDTCVTILTMVPQ